MVGGAQMTREDALDAVIAKQAISDVMQRYCRTLDWLDDEGQASCFWKRQIVRHPRNRGER